MSAKELINKGESLMSTLKERNEERMQKSILGEKPDSHPFYLPISFPFVTSVTKAPLKEYFHNPQLMFETQMELINLLDGVPSLSPDYGLVIEGSALGGQIKFDNNDFISIHASGVSNFDDIKKMKIGDPWGDNYMRRSLEVLTYMKDHAPQNITVDPITIVAPFTAAAQIFGFNDFFLSLYEDPEMVEALLDIVIETEIAFLKEQEKILGKLDFILVADDVSAMIGEDHFRQFVLPTYDRIYSAFPNAERRLHNDANAIHIAGAIADAGFKFWHMGYMNNIIEAAQKTQGKVTICGNLVPNEFLKLSPENAYLACLDMLKIFNGNSKLALCTGGFFGYGTSVDNIRALMRAADEYKI